MSTASDAPQQVARIKRRLIFIQLLLGGLSILIVVIALAVGLLGIGNFQSRPLQTTTSPAASPAP